MNRLSRRTLAGALAGLALAAVPAVTAAKGNPEREPRLIDDTRDSHSHDGLKARVEALEAIAQAQHAEMATFRTLIRELKGWE